MESAKQLRAVLPGKISSGELPSSDAAGPASAKLPRSASGSPPPSGRLDVVRQVPKKTGNGLALSASISEPQVVGASPAPSGDLENAPQGRKPRKSILDLVQPRDAGPAGVNATGAAGAAGNAAPHGLPDGEAANAPQVAPENENLEEEDDEEAFKLTREPVHVLKCGLHHSALGTRGIVITLLGGVLSAPHMLLSHAKLTRYTHGELVLGCEAEPENPLTLLGAQVPERLFWNYAGMFVGANQSLDSVRRGARVPPGLQCQGSCVEVAILEGAWSVGRRRVSQNRERVR